MIAPDHFHLSLGTIRRKVNTIIQIIPVRDWEYTMAMMQMVLEMYSRIVLILLFLLVRFQLIGKLIDKHDANPAVFSKLPTPYSQ